MNWRALLCGVGSVLNIMPPATHRPIRSPCEGRSDVEALAGDWARVGEDMSKAMAEEHKDNVGPASVELTPDETAKLAKGLERARSEEVIRSTEAESALRKIKRIIDESQNGPEFAIQAIKAVLAESEVK